MTLPFPHIDEIPLLVKLVSAGEQMFLLWKAPDLSYSPQGFFPPLTRYKPERALSFHSLYSN